MTLVFERILTEGLGDLSYLVGDDAEGTAVVIDPRADVDAYVDLARRRGVAIRKILQTHVHEDFMSGAVELAARTGAVNYMSHEGDDPRFGFEHEPLRDGDAIDAGDTVLLARHTPGHTPEHLSFLLAEAKSPRDPHAVLSGGSLLVEAAGRTDLLGPAAADTLVKQQYETLYGFFLSLEDDVVVHPTHAHGSSCGAGIGERLETTIGRERRRNPYLRARSFEEFREKALADLPPKPTHYPRLKETNERGPEVLWNLPVVPPLNAARFRDAVASGEATLLDTRSMAAFGGSHVPGAIHIAGSPGLSAWAGWMLDAARPLLLVVEDSGLDDVVRYLLRTGFTRFAGYLAGGMRAWANAGLPLASLPQVSVHDLRERLDDVQVVDVRQPHEWKKGRIPHARHVFLPELPRRMEELDRRRPVVTYCDSGFRASIAASLLLRAGFDVSAVPGSWRAWRRNEFPIER